MASLRGPLRLLVTTLMSDSKPSSNWLALKKKLPSKKRKLSQSKAPSEKKPRTELIPSERPSAPSSSHLSPSTEPSTSLSEQSGSQVKGKLKQMVLGQLKYSEAQKEPGKYLALDCEMVGVGIQGSESSLARVSLVNYHGVVVMDEFVRQKERVVDYRTKWSGIRPKDLVQAKPFETVQNQLASLLKDKILVGHAVYNDLKALLLSHPRSMTRDTQYYAHKFGVCKSGRIALRDLVKQELELTIQSGEHCSVTDARATMAIYRLHQRTFERGIPRHLRLSTSSASTSKPKELEVGSSKRGELKEGIGFGLSTVITRRGGKWTKRNTKTKAKDKSEWWTQMPAIATNYGDSQQMLDRGPDLVQATSVTDWTFG